MGGSNSTALVTNEPATGEQTIFAAALCSVHSCALGMNGESILKSGCSQKTFCLCIRTECQACICSPDSETVLVCQDSRCALVQPKLKIKHNSRLLCLANRFALPCDNDTPCMCAILYLKCCEGHPHPFKVDLRFCAKISQSSGAPQIVEMAR